MSTIKQQLENMTKSRDAYKALCDEQKLEIFKLKLVERDEHVVKLLMKEIDELKKKK